MRAGDVAIERLERGELDAAVSVAQIAHERNPLSPEPLWELAYIEEQRGRLANAQRALEQAVQVQPANAETWRRLGRFQLSDAQPAGAGASTSFRAAYFLDPRNPASHVGLPRGDPRGRPARRHAPERAALQRPGREAGAAGCASKPVASSAPASERRV